MPLSKRGKNKKKNKEAFEPDARERSLVDSWINDRTIPFIGRDGEIGLRDLIMGAGKIDEDRRPLIVDWAQKERGSRPRPSGERTEF